MFDEVCAAFDQDRQMGGDIDRSWADFDQMLAAFVQSRAMYDQMCAEFCQLWAVLDNRCGTIEPEVSLHCEHVSHSVPS